MGLIGLTHRSRSAAARSNSTLSGGTGERERRRVSRSLEDPKPLRFHRPVDRRVRYRIEKLARVVVGSSAASTNGQEWGTHDADGLFFSNKLQPGHMLSLRSVVIAERSTVD